MPVEKGNKVKVDYTGTLEDGSVFDSSEKHGQPLDVQVGSGMIIKGFDDALMGMEVGDEKEITLKPEEAYGENNPQLVQKVPKEQMPKDQEIKAGMVLMMALPNGMQLPAKVVEVSDTEVTVDVNHPLAGKTLNFKLKVVDISEVTEEEKAESLEDACCGGSCGCSEDKEDDGCCKDSDKNEGCCGESCSEEKTETKEEDETATEEKKEESSN